uniref:Uncharacterized protein n=1 Tax=Populus trichocarpa TaxID=3694 RepID=A9P881_POPTR|nr:unknown [Populus trichocarpa]
MTTWMLQSCACLHRMCQHLMPGHWRNGQWFNLPRL